MGLFDSIKAKLGLGDVSNEAERKADTPPADASHSSAEGITLSERPSTTTNATLGPDRDLNQPTAAARGVDVVAQLEAKAAAHPEALNWRTSIVDLMKALDIDSSLSARKELAKELGYTGDTNDSASMNIWLHKQVMTKLAANGGKLPPDIKH